MKRTRVIIVAVLAMSPFAANADLLSVGAGDDGSFHWGDGLGSDMTWTLDDSLGGPHAFDALQITLASASYIDLFSIIDCCVAGDAFALYVDGMLTAWTTSGFTGTGGLFEASVSGTLLSAGAHTIDLIVTADCCTAGAGSWALGDITAEVPEPGTLALLGIGLAGMGFARRRKAKV